MSSIAAGIRPCSNECSRRLRSCTKFRGIQTTFMAVSDFAISNKIGPLSTYPFSTEASTFLNNKTATFGGIFARNGEQEIQLIDIR